jgi:hypothetical protein
MADFQLHISLSTLVLSESLLYLAFDDKVCGVCLERFFFWLCVWFPKQFSQGVRTQNVCLLFSNCTEREREKEVAGVTGILKLKLK